MGSEAGNTKTIFLVAKMIIISFALIYVTGASNHVNLYDRLIPLVLWRYIVPWVKVNGT